MGLKANYAEKNHYTRMRNTYDHRFPIATEATKLMLVLFNMADSNVEIAICDHFCCTKNSVNAYINFCISHMPWHM